MRRKFLVIASVFVVCFATLGATWVLPGKGSHDAPPGFTGLFYSDFEDSGDRDQWQDKAAGWDDDNATTPLEGSFSAFFDTGGTGFQESTGDFTTAATAATVIHARARFRVVTHGNGTSSGPGLTLALSDGTDIAQMSFNASGTQHTVINSTDSAGTTSANPTDRAFDDGTYWLYIVYTPSTNVVVSVMDSGFNLVTGWTSTNSSNLGQTPAQVEVYNFRGSDFRIDNVEVRHDTNWGN